MRKSMPIKLGVLLAVCVAFAWADGAAPPSVGASPDESLQRLQIGNARYLCGKADHPNLDSERRSDTFKNGQKPFAIVLSCADSRVPVEVLMDQGIGDLFVVRVAGNVVDKHELGTIEYGVEHLHAGLLVVMGHRGCGAVAAAISGGHADGNIQSILDDIAPAVETCRSRHPDLKGDALAAECVKANVFHSIGETLRGSDRVRESVKRGSLKIVGAVYDIESGSVSWLGAHPQESELLSGDSPATAKRDAEAASEPAPPKLKGVNAKGEKKRE